MANNDDTKKEGSSKTGDTLSNMKEAKIIRLHTAAGNLAPAPSPQPNETRLERELVYRTGKIAERVEDTEAKLRELEQTLKTLINYLQKLKKQKDEQLQ